MCNIWLRSDGRVERKGGTDTLTAGMNGYRDNFYGGSATKRIVIKEPSFICFDQPLAKMGIYKIIHLNFGLMHSATRLLPSETVPRYICTGNRVSNYASLYCSYTLRFTRLPSKEHLRWQQTRKLLAYMLFYV